MRCDAGGAGSFEDACALVLHGGREPVDELGRVDAGGGAGEQAAQGGADVDPLPDGVGVEEFEVLRVVAVGEVGGVGGFEALHRGRGGGDAQMPAAVLIRVDALVLKDAKGVVDGRFHRALERGDGRSAVLAAPTRGLGVDASVAGDERGEPAAVTAGGAVADLLGLQYRDLRIGLLRSRVVGGPQAGEPAADDHEVLFLVGQGPGATARCAGAVLLVHGAGGLHPMRYLAVHVRGHH